MKLLQLIIDFFAKAGGFIVAGLSVYLLWKARISSYRETLYSKQLEGYIDVAEAMDAVLFILYAVKKERRKHYFFDKRMEFSKKLYRWRHILPDAVVKEFINLNLLLIDMESELDKITISQLDPINKASSVASDSAREYFGIEALSNATRKLIKRLVSIQDN